MGWRIHGMVGFDQDRAFAELNVPLGYRVEAAFAIGRLGDPASLPEAWPPPALAPVGDEIVLRKTSSGVFNSTNIDYLLKNLGIRHVVVAGVLTDQCVDMTVRDGADRGYLMTCVADACAAPTPERHATALQAFGGYCWVTDTDTAALAARLEGGQ